MTNPRSHRKVRVGRVVSDKMDKTVIVAVERRVHHPLYGKSLRRITKFNVHDAEAACHMGDLVRIVETRPLSRTKHWRVLELVSRREVAEVAPTEAIEATVQEVLAAVTEGPQSAEEAASADAGQGTAEKADEQ